MRLPCRLVPRWSPPRPLALALAFAACVSGPDTGPSDTGGARWVGVVVALQDQSAMGFLDPDGALLDTLDLTTTSDGVTLPWMIHNVQIAPDGATAVATAMVPMDGSATDVHDQVVLVDLTRRSLDRRCDVDLGAGVAHVVTDGTTAWVTAYQQDRVLVIDLATCETRDRWPLPPGTGPHGIRRSVDGGSFYVAGYQDGSLHRLDAATGAVTSWDLPGLAVQVAVLPDGSAVFATMQDTRQIARLDLAADTVQIFTLPEGAMGPAQVYPTPDSTAVWVADQGTPDGIVPGREVLRVDAVTGETTARVLVAEAPHGLVVSADGGTVWVTTLGAGTVDRIDTATLERVGSTPVGPGPNGISWSGEGGVMP